MNLEEVIKRQHQVFRQGKMRSISFRKILLNRLENAIKKNEAALYEAFKIDLGKDKAEAYVAEISVVLQEIHVMKKNLAKWTREKRVPSTLGTWPGKAKIYKEPYGVVLVLAPWNYPMLLALSPLVGAIAAGNCVVLKCSKSSPNCAKVLQKIVQETFEKEEVFALDCEMSYEEVLEQSYDYIFFTGSARVGKTIMQRAAKDLIPVSLELGGKSPCIVTKSANLKIAAKRIVWGKLLNAGQTCITVDYILVDNRVKEELISNIEKEISLRYKEAQNNPNYPRIITEHHYQRLLELLEEERRLGTVIGGERNDKERKIAPAIVLNASFDSPTMEEEIFGPIIPVIGYDDLDAAVELVNDRPHPLACYIFTEDKKLAHSLVRTIPFGGGCINDTILHIANHHMPFGGVGNSGMGGYHGKYSIDTFTHKKSVIENVTFLDVPIRYGPLNDKKWKLFKKLL